MATITSPRIVFSTPTQNEVVVSFGVSFAAADLGAGVRPIWKENFPELFPPAGSTTLRQVATEASVALNVVRVVPHPVAGGSPPPLPAPVLLQSAVLRVSRPRLAGTVPVSTRFRYALVPKRPLVFDHLFGAITLTAILRGANREFRMRLSSKTTPDAIVVAANLASPQPNGVVIP